MKESRPFVALYDEKALIDPFTRARVQSRGGLQGWEDKGALIVGCRSTSDGVSALQADVRLLNGTGWGGIGYEGGNESTGRDPCNVL